MSDLSWHATREVARWEFRRFVKPKQLFWSLVLTIVAGGVGYGMSALADRSARASAEIAVIGADDATLAALAGPAADPHELRFVGRPAAAADSLRAAVAARDLDGLLLLGPADRAELVVRRDRPWQDALAARLGVQRQGTKLRAVGLAPERLAAIMAPVRLDVRYAEAGTGGRGARIAAFLTLFAVGYGVFTAVAYIFVSITGEKQQRVTEQMLSAISPQAWIDGKMLGIAGVAAVGVLTTAVAVLLFLGGQAVADGSASWPSMGGLRAGTLLLSVLYALLGFALWLACFGAFAATIDDPNTSMRSAALFLPMLFAGSGALIVDNAESTFARVLAVFPLTSASAMPVRMALADVPWWEILPSLALLALTVAAVRGLAGRMFATAMLMYGKEPGWREVRRWLRADRVAG
jgi:ABC-2 type transport system permease protein